MTRPIELPVYLSPAALRILSVQQILADLSRTGEQQGEVLRLLADGRTSVRIGGRTVDLELDRVLDPGTRFLARLVRGRLVLHLLPPTGRFSVHEQVFEPGLREPALEITVRSLVRTLQDLGLPGDQASISVARAVLLAGLPITRELLRRLRQEIGDLNDFEVDALALALRKRIPFDRSLIGRLGSVLCAQGGCSELLRSMLEMRAALPDVPGLKAVRDALDRLEIWARSRSFPTSGHGLRQWVLDSGIFWESRLLRGDSTDDDLKGLANGLYQAITTASAEEASGVLSRLKQQAADFIDLMTQQQLADLDETFAHDRIWSVEIPVRLDDETTSLRLVVREEGRETEEAEHPIEVQLRIRLSRLGEVAGSLREVGDRLVVSVGTDSADGREALEQNLPALEAFLSELDYAAIRVITKSEDISD